MKNILLLLALVLGLEPNVCAYPKALGRALLPEFSAAKEIHGVRVNLKKNHRYEISIIPQSTIDVHTYVVDKECVIYDVDDDNVAGLPDKGLPRSLEITPEKTDYFYIVVVDYSGKGFVKVQISEDFDIA